MDRVIPRVRSCNSHTENAFRFKIFFECAILPVYHHLSPFFCFQFIGLYWKARVFFFHSRFCFHVNPPSFGSVFLNALDLLFDSPFALMMLELLSLLIRSALPFPPFYSPLFLSSFRVQRIMLRDKIGRNEVLNFLENTVLYLLEVAFQDFQRRFQEAPYIFYWFCAADFYIFIG